MRIGPQEGFEVAFNLACAQLACDDLEAAHEQLLHAQRLGASGMRLCIVMHCHLCSAAPHDT